MSVYVFSVVFQSKITLGFWFTNVLDMTESAFHKVYYKSQFEIKVIEDTVRFFSDIACKTASMYNLFVTQVSRFCKSLVENVFCSLSSFALCYLQYFYIVIRRVTRRGRRGEVSPALFQNLKKSALILGKNALTRFIYGFNFSFKMLF